MLESYVRERQRKSPGGILLMTHVVAGYPSFDASLRLIEAMVSAGVDLMEIQIPFSEPVADGPVILRANQEALRAGATVDRCLELATQVSQRFEIPFLIMSYFNIVFRRGVRAFAASLKKAGIRGLIVPDLPPPEDLDRAPGPPPAEGEQSGEHAANHEAEHEGGEYLEAMRDASLDPIFIFAPTTPLERLSRLGRQGGGFIYCVARKGVTGSATEFSTTFDAYLERARRATALPLAVGFGITNRAEIDYLRGKADIAVVGSETLRVLDRDGLSGVERFIRDLR